jgi:lipopolysaccharide/colanic/teichoic acid biosynthesis glycosyltransferase
MAEMGFNVDGGLTPRPNSCWTSAERQSERKLEAPILSPHWQSKSRLACKRLMDLSAGLMLVALLPMFVVIGGLVKLTSRGPIFYRWRVVGKDGRPFVGYKFRTMVENADELKSRLQSQNEMSGPVFKMTNDPRVTRLGAWLRRYSLDELPQLYSVFKGNMSLVGPRPPLVTEYEHFSPSQKGKLTVRPGITCLWQISGRNQVNNFDSWVALDLEYIRNWSLGLDLKILLRTLGEVFEGSGK